MQRDSCLHGALKVGQLRALQPTQRQRRQARVCQEYLRARTLNAAQSLLAAGCAVGRVPTVQVAVLMGNFRYSTGTPGIKRSG